MDERCSGSGSGSGGGGGGGGGGCLGYTWRVGGDVACSTHDCLVGNFWLEPVILFQEKFEIFLIFLPVHISNCRIHYPNRLIMTSTNCYTFYIELHVYYYLLAFRRYKFVHVIIIVCMHVHMYA